MTPFTALSTGDALLRACLKNPDDDTPRLAYADWLDENGDPNRAELIRIQIELARDGDTMEPKHQKRLKARESRLIKAHEAAWLPLPGQESNLNFLWRGLLGGGGDVTTDDETAAVARFREFDSIGVSDAVTDAGLTHLSYLDCLEELHFHGGVFSADGMRSLARLPRLRRMYLQDVRITGRWFHYFLKAPQLVRVWAHSVEGHGITPKEWSNWEEVRAKRFRRLSAEEQKDEARAFLSQQWSYEFDDDYRSIRLIQGRISDADVEIISALPGLHSLDLYDTAITNRMPRHLKGVATLRKLEIGKNDIDSLDALAGMTQLRELALGFLCRWRRGQYEMTLTDAGTAALATLTGLESLDLEYNPITDATLRHLAGLPNLKRLELRETQVTDAGLVHLRSLKRLAYLDVERTAVTAAGARKLQTHLPKLEIAGVE